MSAAVRAGYKQTEVGVIPEDWKVTPLCELAELTSSKRIFEGDYVPFGIPFFRGKEISMLVEGDSIDDPCFISEARFTAIKSRFGVPSRGDILITAVGTLGNVYVVDTDVPFYFKDGNLIWLRSIVGIAPNFLGIQLRRAKSAILDGAIGSSQKALTMVVLRKLPIPTPPPTEQRAIAAALSDVDALLAKLDALIAKKRDLKVATMQQLLTGQTRLPGFSGEWEVKRLGDVLSRMANGAVYKPTNSRGIQITRIETIADGTIDYSRTGVAEDSPELERYKIMPGDILFSHINSVDHIGKVAIFNGEQSLYHGMNLLLLRTNKDADCNFLYLWFTSLPARRQTRNLAKQAVSQASINTKELKALEMRLPPLQEQTAIATVLSDMETELTALEARLDKTRALKQGMMQELLTGRIRLI